MTATRHALLRTDELYVADVRCADPPAGWTAPRPAAVFGLVLVRAGVFRARVDGVDSTLDPVSVYVERLGSEQQFAHPCGGDRYTELVPAEPLLASLLGGEPTVPQGLVFVTPAMALQHRLLFAPRSAGHGCDVFSTTERAVALTAAALTQLAPDRVASGAPATSGARRRLADAAREALAADHGVGLPALARALACSPHHLSRAFRAATGTTLSRYRNRLRVARALDRLADGERDLAALAADLGFADQAHMTHVVRAESGLPPGRLRALLAPAGSPDPDRRPRHRGPRAPRGPGPTRSPLFHKSGETAILSNMTQQVEASGLTVDELAARAGVTVRTIRFYGTRGLLPPPVIGPRRVGRYGPEHLSRLALIEELQHQGLTLAAIERYVQRLPADLSPEDHALHRALVATWIPDAAAEVSRAELERRAGRSLTDDDVARLEAMGVLEPAAGAEGAAAGEGTGDPARTEAFRVDPGVLHLGVRLLDVPMRLETILAARDVVQEHTRAVARELTRLFRDEVWEPFDEGGPDPEQVETMKSLSAHMQPMVVQALVTAFQRSMKAELKAEFPAGQ